MTKIKTVEKIAQDICDLGGNCLTCNAATHFECTAKKYATKFYDLYLKPSAPKADHIKER